MFYTKKKEQHHEWLLENVILFSFPRVKGVQDDEYSAHNIVKFKKEKNG